MAISGKRLKIARERVRQTIKKVKKRVDKLRLSDLTKTRKGRLFSFVKEIELKKGVEILRLKGRMNASTIPQMMSNRKFTEKVMLDRDMILDMEYVTETDSSTLAAFILLISNLKAHNRRLAIINVPQTLKKQLKFNRLKYFLRIYKSEKAAMNEFLE